MWSLLISFVALIAAVTAAIYTIKTFFLKKGCQVAVQLRRILISSTNIEPYVSQIILENRKDKEVTVYNIYVQINESIYLDLLHQLPDRISPIKPILLPPFGVKIINLGPPIAYNEGTLRVDNANELFKYKWENIVLSTNYGKVIAESVTIWEPSSKQDNTKIIYPIWLHYGGSDTYESPSIHSHTRFLVTITHPDGRKQYQQLFDYDLRELLKSEQFTEDLVTVEQVKRAIRERWKDQLYDGTNLQVYDVRNTIDEKRKNTPFGIETIDWNLSYFCDI